MTTLKDLKDPEFVMPSLEEIDKDMLDRDTITNALIDILI